MAEASEKPLPRPRPLAAAPPRIVEAGAPIEGTWSGPVADASFARLAGEWRRGFLDKRLVEKRWTALFLATKEAMLSFAIVDAGYLSSGILCVFDRGSRRTLIDSPRETCEYSRSRCRASAGVTGAPRAVTSAQQIHLGSEPECDESDIEHLWRA